MMKKVMVLAASVMVLLAAVICLPARAYAGTTEYVTMRVGQTKSLSAKSSNSSINSAAWSSSDTSAVRIVSGAGSTSCVIEVVSVPRNNQQVLVHCDYNYIRYVSGSPRLGTGYSDYYITVTSTESGGGTGTGGYTLSASVSSLKLDLRMGSQSVNLTSGMPLSSSVYITDDTPSGSGVVYAEQVSTQNNTAFYSIHPEKTGTQTITFKLVEKSGSTLRIKDSVTVRCSVSCSHAYDDGKVAKDPTPTSDGVKTYTCRYCDNKKTEAIKYEVPEEPESAQDQGEPANVSVSEENVSLEVGESKTITVTVGGSLPSTYSLVATRKGTCFEKEWSSKISNGRCTLKVTGIEAGSGTIAISVKDKLTGEVVAKTLVGVTVNGKDTAGEATIESSVSEVKLTAGESTDITITAGGDLPRDYCFVSSRSGRGYTTKWVGSWKGTSHDLRITGSAEGSGTITISIKDGDTGEMLTETKVKVTVGPKDEPASIRTSVDSLELAVGESREFVITADGNLPDGYTFAVDADNSHYGLEWTGDWDGDSHPLTITGVSEYSGYMTVYLKNTETKEVLVKTKVRLTVS